MKRLFVRAMLLSLVTGAVGCADETPEVSSGTPATTIPAPPDPAAAITVTLVKGRSPNQTVRQETMTAGEFWRLVTRRSPEPNVVGNGAEAIRNASVIETCTQGSWTVLYPQINYSGNPICFNNVDGTADIWTVNSSFVPRSGYSSFGVNLKSSSGTILVAWCSGFNYTSNFNLSSTIRFVSSPASAQGPCHF